MDMVKYQNSNSRSKGDKIMAVYNPTEKEERQTEIRNLSADLMAYMKKLGGDGKLEELNFLTDVMNHLDQWKPFFDLINRLAKNATDNSIQVY